MSIAACYTPLERAGAMTQRRQSFGGRVARPSTPRNSSPQSIMLGLLILVVLVFGVTFVLVLAASGKPAAKVNAAPKRPVPAKPRPRIPYRAGSEKLPPSRTEGVPRTSLSVPSSCSTTSGSIPCQATFLV